MIALFVKFLPYILIIYLLYRSYKYPVFIMGIPFLMFLGPSIFFEQVTLLRIPFRAFDSISQNEDIFLFVWLVIFWIIFRIRSENDTTFILRPNLTEKSFNILDNYIVSLIIITIIGFGIVINEYYMLDKVYDQFIVLLSLFLGYFIIKDITSRIDINILHSFLFNIVIFNTIASGLYFIHQGMQITIYQGEEYSTTVFQGAAITRTFWFMPRLWSFSIAYLILFRKNNYFTFIILLTINLLAIYISYTRSTLITAFFIIFLYFLFDGFKKKEYNSILKNILITGVAGVALFFAVSTFMPASTNYFLSRFTELEEKPVNAESNNLVFRFFRTGKIINKIDAEKELFGYGSVTENQLPFVKIVNAVTADMGWAEVVFRWGYFGLILFILLYVSSIIKAFFLFMRTEELKSQIAFLLFLTIISQVIEGFISFTIMAPGRFPLGLWYFGILSALMLISKNNNSKNEGKAKTAESL